MLLQCLPPSTFTSTTGPPREIAAHDPMTIGLIVSLILILTGAMILVFVILEGINAFRRWSSTTTNIKPGRGMPDDTIYVGVSPENGQALFPMPHDIDGLLTWHDAMQKARHQIFGGHADWRLPTKKELDYLHAHRTAIGSFKLGSYWSSSEESRKTAWSQLFMSGYQSFHFKNDTNRVRYVRTGPNRA